MKSHTGKIGLLFLALVIALGGLGVGFAAWTDTITLQGTVNTAAVNWEITGSAWGVEWQEPCYDDETAWALCDGDGCFSCPTGWGKYFTYHVDDPAMVVPLVAGQNIPVGDVTVSTAGDTVIVEYSVTEDDWEIMLSHLYVGTSAPAKCAPGLFPYSSEKDPSVVISPQVHRYVITGFTACDDVYVAAHAEVAQPCGIGGIVEVSVSIEGHNLIVDWNCIGASYYFTILFEVTNTGSIPIRLSNITYNEPDNVDVNLLTPELIGFQMEPGQSLQCKVGITVSACETAGEQIIITVHAVQWHLW